MTPTPTSQKAAARQFVEFWTGKGYEKGQTQPFLGGLPEKKPWNQLDGCVPAS